jgi:hypothetical protein
VDFWIKTATIIAVIALIVAALLFFLFYFVWIEKRKPGKNRARETSGADSAAQTVVEGVAGDAETCPVCAARFLHGETVVSKALPPTGKKGRLLYISGCRFCMDGSRRRTCPVCGKRLAVEDVLVARLFETTGRSHVSILGCPHCRRRGNQGMERRAK